MEEEQNNPNNNLVQNNNRNLVRTLTFQSALRASENSLITLAINIIYYFIKLSICAFFILKYPTSTTKPLQRFVINSVLADLIFTYLLLRRLSNIGADQESNILSQVGYLFYFSNQIYGNYIYFTCDMCNSENPELSGLSLWLLIMGYLNMFLPCLLLCCVIVCLNLAIVILSRTIPSQQRPATESAINRLKPELYKPSNAEGFDDECIICSEIYKEDDLVLYLSCGNNHKFHDSCLKKWIRINSVCPICRHVIE